MNGRSPKGKAKQQRLQAHIATTSSTRGSEGWLASEIRGKQGDGVGGPVTGPLVLEIPCCRLTRVGQES
jgi:hypothetical protein